MLCAEKKLQEDSCVRSGCFCEGREMAILFTVLKIIGIVLLAALALAVAALLIVLLVPIRYRFIGVVSKEEPSVKAEATWLLKIIRVRVGFNKEGGLSREIRVFGRRLGGKGAAEAEAEAAAAWNAEEKAKEAAGDAKQPADEAAKPTEAAKNPSGEAKKPDEAAVSSADPGTKSPDRPAKASVKNESSVSPGTLKEKTEGKQEVPADGAEKDGKKQNLPEDGEKKAGGKKKLLKGRAEKAGAEGGGASGRDEALSDASEDGKLLRILEKVFGAAGRIAEKALGNIDSLIMKVVLFPYRMVLKLNRLMLKFFRLLVEADRWASFLTDSRTKQAVSRWLRAVKKIIGHILPKKLKADVRYGMADPAATGYIAAGTAVLYPKFGDSVSLCPVFDGECLDGKAAGKGRVFLGYVLVKLLGALLHPSTFYVIKFLRHKKEERS